MLEKMANFFENRLSDYDEHMRRDILGAKEFYPFTAACLPACPGAKVLDLGCGTGLELEDYYKINKSADITGIDLSQAMLNKLAQKFPDKKLTLICGSYFEEDMGLEVFDAAVSVESLHHFTKEEKIPLYKKLFGALKSGGYFILTDYFADTTKREEFFAKELLRLKKENGINDNEFYHYDTPLTVEHETQALLSAGFTSVKVLKSWENTYTLKAQK